MKITLVCESHGNLKCHKLYKIRHIQRVGMSFKITWNAFQNGPFNGPGENNYLQFSHLQQSDYNLLYPECDGRSQVCRC